MRDEIGLHGKCGHSTKQSFYDVIVMNELCFQLSLILSDLFVNMHIG
jgi:hypothetical protein